jgi:hypothetical protein
MQPPPPKKKTTPTTKTTNVTEITVFLTERTHQSCIIIIKQKHMIDVKG